MDRSRRSRFADSEPEVTSPTTNEKVTLDERINRDLAATQIQIETDPRVVQRAEGAYEVRPEREVATGARVAVEQAADDWRVRWVLVEQNGSLVVRSLHLEPDERPTPPGGVTTNLLRELSPSAAIAAAATHVAAELDQTSWTDLQLIWAAQDAREHAPTQTARTSGRPRLSDVHLAAVAAAYLDEMQHGPGVLRRLGERFDREPETMRDQVRIARKRGFLTTALGSGRKGAAAGPRLIEMSERTTEVGMVYRTDARWDHQTRQ